MKEVTAASCEICKKRLSQLEELVYETECHHCVTEVKEYVRKAQMEYLVLLAQELRAELITRREIIKFKINKALDDMNQEMFMKLSTELLKIERGLLVWQEGSAKA